MLQLTIAGAIVAGITVATNVDAISRSEYRLRGTIQSLNNAKGAIVAIEHAVLGLLLLEPRHGYQLTKEFDEQTVLGGIVRLEPGMLYAHLKKLERAEWITASMEPQETRPPRRVFEITPAGRDELNRWLQEPVERTRDLRLEFLLKLYLARQIDVSSTERLIHEQREVCQGFVRSLEEQLEAESDDFGRLVIEMRLAQNQALARWLDRAAAEVQPSSP